MSANADEVLAIPGGGALFTDAPAFVVDLDQRVTRFNGLAARRLGSGRDIRGLPCHAVMTARFPEAAAVCRPNCPVITGARAGRPSPDVTLPCAISDTSERLQLSTMVIEDALGNASVLHLIRAAGQRPAPPIQAASHTHDGTAPVQLTQRQREVLALLAEGYSPGQIADRLGIRPLTVRNHLQAAMERIGARSRLEAVLTALATDLIQTDAAG